MHYALSHSWAYCFKANLPNRFSAFKVTVPIRKTFLESCEVSIRSTMHRILLTSVVIHSNWHPISYRFGVIAAYCSNFAPTRSLWLEIPGTRGRLPPIIFARIVRPMNALQVCPWQFSHRCYGWSATSENRAKIKPTISHQLGHFDPKFQVQGVAPPTNHFCMVS